MGNTFFYDSNGIIQSDYEVSFKTVIKEDYSFVNGDQSFYSFVGDRSRYTLPDLLAKEDVNSFYEAVIRLPEKPQVFMARMQAGDDKYYLLFFMLKYSGSIIDKNKLIEVQILDFQSMQHRYADYIANEKKFATFLSMAPQLFLEYDIESDILQVYRYINYRPTTIFNNKMKDFIDDVIQDADYTQEDKSNIYNFYECLKDDAERFEASISAKTIRKEDIPGYFKFKCVSFYEGSKRTKKIGIIDKTDVKEELRYYLTDNAFDLGTGVFNKRAINEYGIDKFNEAKMLDKTVFLAVFDVDDFKNLNDTYGHLYGDMVLSKIADIVRNEVKDKGACGRFGGDEFMIVFDKVDETDEIRNIVKTIRKNISYVFLGGKEKQNVTTSWGIAKFPNESETFEELFDVADKALYIAKEKGKDRFIIYEPDKHHDIAVRADEKRSAGFRSLANGKDKAITISSLILDMNTNGTQNIQYMLDTIKEYLDLDGISIYKGDKLTKIYRIGKYIENVDDMQFAKRQFYLEHFDENDIYSENTIPKLKYYMKSDYSWFEKQEITRFIQFKKGKDENMTIVSFDFFNRSPKISDMDFAFLVVVGTTLATAVCNDKNI